jgi:hypothetical protein
VDKVEVVPGVEEEIVKEVVVDKVESVDKV